MSNQLRKIFFLRKLATISCYGGIGIGVATLLGWWGNVSFVQGALPSDILMNPLIAVCFILCGASLLCLSQKQSHWMVQWMGNVLSFVVVGISLIKLGGLAIGWDTGIDGWIFHDKVVNHQMAITTTINLFLLGSAVLILRRPFKSKFHPAEVLLFIVMIVSIFVAMSHVYNISSFSHTPLAHVSVALTTAVIFLLYVFAAFSFGLNCWFTRLIIGEGVGSKIARRFLLLLPLPLVLSLLRLQGQKLGLYSAEFGTAFFTLCAIIFFAAVILINAELFNQIDAKHQKAELDTKESEARLKLALKGGRIGVWDWNIVHNQLVWDEQMYQIYGVDKNKTALSFADWEQAVLPEDRERAKKEVQKALTGEKDLDMEFIVIWPDDSIHYIKAAALVVRDKQGVATRMIGMNWDTTELRKTTEKFAEAKKQADEAKVFLDSIVENIPNMIFVKDAKELRFVRFNKAGERLIGISRDVMLGKNDYDFFPKDQADFFIDKDREALRKGETFDIPEEYIDTKTGKKILHTKKVTIRNEQGEPKYLLGISEDVTEIKLAEKKLQETLVDLERSNKELEQFAYVASHDLQEPLRTVASFCQLLEKRYHDQLDDKAKGYINYAVDGSKRMQVMIDELLGYARAGKKDVERSSIDLNMILEKILLDLKIMIKENRAMITVKPLPVVIANQTQMTQLFQNLIINALKFRSQIAPVIEISAEQKEQGWEFIVKDNGIGIKQEYFDQIFIIFQRLHSKAAYAGTGIGLALCKKIVENYGGRIWVKSEVGQGTSFHFIVST